MSGRSELAGLLMVLSSCCEGLIVYFYLLSLGVLVLDDFIDNGVTLFKYIGLLLFYLSHQHILWELLPRAVLEIYSKNYMKLMDKTLSNSWSLKKERTSSGRKWEKSKHKQMRPLVASTKKHTRSLMENWVS